MKRLWIRAHALPEVHDLAFRWDLTDDEQRINTLIPSGIDPNEMIVFDISDELAAEVQHHGFLTMCGRVLNDGEEPPELTEGKRA